ncbi:DUF4089 domain-containing protein [Rhodovulum sp. 12E13]|uniref:DUF4089 domain-containing protein n=1 Tax=Rhodovulum sp. 12E13 TaxID=2203891 RepID=UPI000E1A7792|nr:DUF4089 domain-containing protein [Rhodovulum sp. 12E13]RDC75395.1 DUF4089 domain-containing protein [Rhodovulum sp. 12E13]
MPRNLTPPPGFDAEGYARAAAPAIGLPLPEEAVAEVAANLARTAGFAALLADVPEIDTAEPAPVFRAGEGER